MATVNETETTDEVIQEVRRIKEALAAAMDFDVDRIVEDVKRKQKESGREVVPPPPRRPA
jgi:hypothetical protein